MTKRLKKILGEGPYPCPLEDFKKLVDVHMTEKVVVVAPKLGMDFEKGCHAHESYEFFVPYSPMPPCNVEKKILTFEINKMYALNSEQSHGTATTKPGCRILAFMADKEFVSETSRMVYGKSTVEFEFEGIDFDSELKGLIHSFIEENMNKQTGYEFMMETISTQIMVKLLRQMKNNLPDIIREQNYAEVKGINRVIEFFMEHYHDEYSLQDVAQIANLSPYHFIRVFKAQTHKTPYEYLMDIKIDKAKAMLKDPNLTITDVCYRCGFNNLNHFGNAFKRRVGVSPSHYRKWL